MSRIGKKPIDILEGVEVVISELGISVKGSKGEIFVPVHRLVKVTEKDKKLTVEPVNSTKLARSLHGTMRQLIDNAIKGVVSGFEKKLEIVGIGYRAAIENNELVLIVGFTHPVKLAIPEGTQAKVEKSVITVNGFDKQVVGQFAANIRAVKKPEPYKGKGIRYQGEIVRMKAGKAAKSAG